MAYLSSAKAPPSKSGSLGIGVNERITTIPGNWWYISSRRNGKAETRTQLNLFRHFMWEIPLGPQGG
jgi:hypothetical protein